MKNSLETAYKSKKQLPIKTAQLIDEACIIGYQSIENEKQLQNMTNCYIFFPRVILCIFFLFLLI